jgi:hypothetical protein
MNTDEFKIFLTFFIGFMMVMGAVTKVIVTWIKRPRPQKELPSDIAERLERIERAVESTAIEVERIGEGQRFLTRALGERSVVDTPRKDAGGRVVTPH